MLGSSNLMADFPDLVTIYNPAHLPPGFCSQIHPGIPHKEYITDISQANKCFCNSLMVFNALLVSFFLLIWYYVLILKSLSVTRFKGPTAATFTLTLIHTDLDPQNKFPSQDTATLKLIAFGLYSLKFILFFGFALLVFFVHSLVSWIVRKLMLILFCLSSEILHEINILVS
jgi:hypothetical protein